MIETPYQISVIIEKDENGYYAYCPQLEGCQTQGDSLEEIKANIQEAIELYLSTLSEVKKYKMTLAANQLEVNPFILQLSPVIDMTDEQFFQFCQLNRDYRFERTAKGELIIMSPTGSETGNRNFNLRVQLGIWSEKDGTGIGFDSSTGFKLPNGADRSPDAAWMKLEKWNTIPQEQRVKFAPVCPDFVVEIRSPSDKLQSLQDKLQEYIAFPFESWKRPHPQPLSHLPLPPPKRRGKRKFIVTGEGSQRYSCLV